MIGEVSQLANDFWILLAMVIYFAAMLSIGFIYSKRSNSSSKEYFAGGRGVGPWLTALSAEASDMSGWLLMGLPGLAYFTGAADPMWTAVGLALGTYLNWKLVARRLRRYSVVTDDAITIPDFFAKRFHDKKGVISTIAAVIILVFFSVYVGSCFVTVGKLFATLFGFDYHVMMIIGAVVVFVYTVVGGYLSVVMTDFIQGMLMFFALAVVFIGTVASAGGVDNTVEFLRAIPGYLSGTQVAAPAGPGHRPAARRGGQGRVRRALRLRHHHHHLHAGVGPGLLRYAAGAGALPVHPQRGRSAQVPNHRHLLVRDFAGLRSVHRQWGVR